MDNERRINIRAKIALFKKFLINDNCSCFCDFQLDSKIIIKIMNKFRV